jgi:hypothetical protein
VLGVNGGEIVGGSLNKIKVAILMVTDPVATNFTPFEFIFGSFYDLTSIQLYISFLVALFGHYGWGYVYDVP